MGRITRHEVEKAKSQPSKNSSVDKPNPLGSGTTAVVAKLDRHFLGCDLNPEYVKIAEERLRGVSN